MTIASLGAREAELGARPGDTAPAAEAREQEAPGRKQEAAGRQSSEGGFLTDLTDEPQWDSGGRRTSCDHDDDAPVKIAPKKREARFFFFPRIHGTSPSAVNTPRQYAPVAPVPVNKFYSRYKTVRTIYRTDSAQAVIWTNTRASPGVSRPFFHPGAIFNGTKIVEI